ncbi:hypothetical protein TNCV_3190831 [Trichonephila clavipes]|nr:hypothetical protein TNCV_3190831 [Trichonephila clavipes]
MNCLTAYQTDISPIEHVWNMLGKRVYQPGNVDDLIPQLEQIWQEIPLDCFITLCYVVWLLASKLEGDQHLIELVTL